MPDGTVNLTDVARSIKDEKQQAIVGTYATSYQPMAVLPLLNQPSGVHSWNLEVGLPNTTGGARNYNGTYTASKTRIASFAVNSSIYGGQVKIDRMFAKINPSQVPLEKAAQIKAMAYNFTKDVFEGAGGTYLRGIKDYLDNESIFSAQTSDIGTASGGTALVTDHLDKLLSLINFIPGRTYFYMTDNVGLRARKIARGNSASGDTAYNLNYSKDEWGYFSGSYGGVPIVVLKDGKGNNLLSTDEGDGSSSSVYAVTYGVDNFTGFQVGNPEVIAANDSSVYNYFDLEHGVGTAVKSIRSIARLRYVAESV